MPRHRTNTRSVELLQRSGEIKQLCASLSVRADKPRSLPPERGTMFSIDIVGELTAPLAGTSAFSLMAFVTPNPTIGRAQPPSIGAITAIKPMLQGAVDLSPSEFQFLLTMASGGLLKYCHLVTTKPRYRSALIVSIDFSTRPPPSHMDE